MTPTTTPTATAATLDPEDALEALAEAGARFALPSGRTKKPGYEGWQNAPRTLHAAQVHNARGGNVGILTGAHSGGIVALDLDTDFEGKLALLGEDAETWRIVRDNAPGRGKLLYRCTDLDNIPPTASWKPQGAKHPHAEFLANGRHALCPPSEFDGGRYLLEVAAPEIRPMTPAQLNALWFLVTGEFLTPVAAHPAAQERREERRRYIEQVKGYWTPEAVFRHFGKDGGTVEERGEVRLLGNGGLLVKGELWFCHADDVGGDALDAWHWCEHGTRLPREAGAFWDVVEAMGRAAGIEAPAATHGAGAFRNGAGYTNGHVTAEDAAAIGLGRPQGTAGTWELQTDMGNALRLARLFGGELRFVNAWGWLHWDGQRWRHDDSGRAMQYAKATARDLYQDGIGALQAATAEAEAMRDALGGNPSQAAAKRLEEQIGELLAEAKAALGWAVKSQGRQRLEAMLALAQSDAPIPARAEDFDTDPWRLNCANGIVNLRTGELEPHSPDAMCTRLAPVAYDAGASCPTWLAFLERIFKGDGVLIDYLQRWLGYCLTGHVSEQSLHILWGSGANGKSVLVTTLLALLGDYGAMAAPELLLDRDGKHPTEVADLQGRRFVVAVETDEGRRLAEGLVKSLTGGDRVKARRMREDFWEFAPTHKLALVTNHKPRVKGTDYAIWRRLRLVPFETTIPEAEQDPNLPAKLQRELPGILAWCVRGCLAWQEQGLAAPDVVKAATEEYRTDSDPLTTFLQECVERTEDERDQVAAKDFYQTYKNWCEAHGERYLSATAFGLRMADRGFDKYTATTGRTYYMALRLVAYQQKERLAGVEDAEELGL